MQKICWQAFTFQTNFQGSFWTYQGQYVKLCQRMVFYRVTPRPIRSQTQFRSYSLILFKNYCPALTFPFLKETSLASWLSIFKWKWQKMAHRGEWTCLVTLLWNCILCWWQFSVSYHLWIPNLKMSCWELTLWQSTRIVVLTMSAEEHAWLLWNKSTSNQVNCGNSPLNIYRRSHYENRTQSPLPA